MRLHLIRHGDPDYENDCLTARGRSEAAALGTRMSTTGLTRLFTSPLGRARETASFIETDAAMTAKVLPWTTELELPPITDATGMEIAPWAAPGAMIRGADRTSSLDMPLGSRLQSPELETRQHEIITSSDAFLGSLGYRRIDSVYEVHAPHEESIAIVCHMGFGLTWLAHLLQLPLALVWCGMHWAPTSVTTVLMEERGGGIAVPRALTVGDVSHLHAAGLAETNQGLLGNSR